MEKSLFIEKISNYIKKQQLLPPNSKVIITLSGGADSVALLISLHLLGYKCLAAHCNFHLRGQDSIDDENFSRNLAESLSIPFEITHFDVPTYERQHGVSTEMACRELRYAWFEELSVRYGINHIAVGHHIDDNKETFFLNLLRGTGIKGLAAIKPQNGKIVRPLLCVTRKEIEDFLSTLKQNFVTDRTNLENDFKRNKLRNILFPEIDNLFPENNIKRTIDNIYSCNEFYQGAIKNAVRECLNNNSLDIAKLKEFEGYHAVLLEVVSKFNFNSSQAEEMSNIIESKEPSTGKEFYSSTHIALFNRGKIEFSQFQTNNCKTEYIFNLNNIPTDLPIKLSCKFIEDFKNFKFERNPKKAYFDAKITDKEIKLRKWHDGDRFSPFGMKGKKKLSDLFVDEKLSLTEKQNVWILEVDNEIVWIVGIKNSNSFTANKNCRMIEISVS